MTQALLTMSLVEDTGTSDCPIWPAVDHIQSWLAANHRGGNLFEVSAPQGPDAYCPGGVFAGEFKNLHHDAFVEAVRSAPWQWPEKVRLFMRDERSEVFDLVSLGEARGR